MKKFFIRLFWKPYCWYGNICNIISWILLLWKDREWDYSFMLEIERKKLNNMCNWYLNNNYGTAVTGKRTYRQMKLAVNLLDIILGNDDWWTIDIDRPLIIDGKYIGREDSDILLTKYVNLNNYQRYLPYLRQESIDRNPNLWSVELREAKAWYLYHRLKCQYMRTWWD